jgi:hypothetical protein
VNERDQRVKPPDIIAAEMRVPKEVRAVITAVAAEVASYIKQLHERVAELEAHQALFYAGTWSEGAGKAFGKGAACTHHGSLWIATRATCSEPGTPDSGWQLAVKRGRDGKDAKRRL